MVAVVLAPERIKRCKAAYSVRRLDLDRPLSVLSGRELRPRYGDLVLARVAGIGQHPKLETTVSRRATLYVGDEVVVAYGARYAPDQFEAELPEDLDPCELVAAGGVAARVCSRHSSMTSATRLEPVGLLADAHQRRLNVADAALPAPATPLRHPPTVLVAGTSMNAGKTTTVASLVHGLSRAGLRVGACKINGTGAGGDPYLYRDAGADEVLDFTDDGLVATYRVPVEQLVGTAERLHAHLAGRDVDAIAMEIADGVLQPETAALLAAPQVQALTDAVLFAAGDAAGALLGVDRVRRAGLPVVAVSGLLTASPLATREAQACLDVPVYDTTDLSDPVLARSILDRARADLAGPDTVGAPETCSQARGSDTEPATAAPAGVELVAAGERSA